MQVAAKLKYARISPQKCRLVADTVRGRKVGNALALLRFQPKKGAALVLKVLESAIANAQQKSSNVDVDTLYISRIQINGGPIAKRIRPAPQGRAYRVQKRTSHVHIYLNEKGK